MDKVLSAEAMKIWKRFQKSYSDKKNAIVKEYKGYRFQPPFDPETAMYGIQQWDIPERTVFVASYPKTGSHWCIEIIHNIMYRRDKKTLELLEVLPNLPLFRIEFGSKEKYKLFEHFSIPRWTMATHVQEELFDFKKLKEKKGKVIYVIRNPKDRLVSFYHFAKNLPWANAVDTKKKDGTLWNDFYNQEMMGKHPILCKEGDVYQDHILGWIKHKDDKDFLLVSFEDMKKDLKKEVARIAEFLEVQLTDEEVAATVDACTFTSMKKLMDTAEGRQMEKGVGVMRKGEVGEWKELFTVAQSEQMDKQVEEKLAHTGIKFTYEL